VIQSMTGFSEKSYVSSSLRLKICIKSLNHRFFDWNYKGSPIGELENRLRTVTQNRIHRGHLEVYLEMASLNPDSWTIVLNEPLLEKILGTLDRVSSRMSRKLDFPLDQIFKIPQLAEIHRKEISESERAFIEKSYEDVLAEVIKRRQKEGKETVKKIRQHVRNVRRSVGKIEQLFKKQPRRIEEKLKQRLRDINHGSSFSEERLAEEASFLAQRYDLAEEIVRLKSHLTTFEGLLGPKVSKPVGKKMDFLVQEIYREANTSSSRSQDIDIIRESLAVKNEIESIRQHIQNIE